MRVRLVPHDPAWKDAFNAEDARAKSALCVMTVLVHHIGSTAIPGIFAKPIIDILLEVDDVEELDRQTPSIEALGYEAMGEFGIAGRRYFRKDDAGVRTHHIHAFQMGSLGASRHLAFRDYMIMHPDEARAYSALKQQRGQGHPDDIKAYMNGKDAYVKEQERRAIVWWTRHRRG